jgi:hypothetical protein
MCDDLTVAVTDQSSEGRMVICFGFYDRRNSRGCLRGKRRYCAFSRNIEMYAPSHPITTGIQNDQDL